MTEFHDVSDPLDLQRRVWRLSEQEFLEWRGQRAAAASVLASRLQSDIPLSREEFDKLAAAIWVNPPSKNLLKTGESLTRSK